MPFYRYECLNCKLQFRVLQQNGSRDLVVCPSCGGKRTERLLHRIGVIYKGSGYYATDYRSRKSVKKNDVGSKEPASTTSESEG